jgi:hypothetical protein
MKALEISNLQVGSKISDWSVADRHTDSRVFNSYEVIEIRGLAGVLLKNLETSSTCFHGFEDLLSDNSILTSFSRL